MKSVLISVAFSAAVALVMIRLTNQATAGSTLSKLAGKG